jgi:hypothetical protein
MGKTLFYIIFFVSILNSNADNYININWCHLVFQNPDKYITDNYEKHIFKKFISKFPNIKIKKVYKIQNTCFAETIINSKQSYILSFDLDKNNNIKKISRHLIQFDFENKSIREIAILKWLFKFFYYLDAGAKEAMYDMVFHEETKIQYFGLSDKKEIITKLIKDFPIIILPNSINVTEEQSSYFVRVSIKLMENIYLEITNKLSNLTDTYELQEDLFNRIKRSILEEPKNTKSLLTKDKIFEKITQIYPNAIVNSDTVTIPHPKQGIKVMDGIEYLIQDTIFKPMVASRLKLNYNEENSTIILNNAYPISFYKSPQIENLPIDQLTIALESVYNLFIQFCHKNNVINFGQMTGEVQYRGYQKHNLDLKNIYEWNHFWNVLYNEGSVYFYPSRIDYLKNEINIQGLLYVIKDQNMNFYHFGELITHLPQERSELDVKLELNFYPFLSRIGVSSFNEN